MSPGTNDEMTSGDVARNYGYSVRSAHRLLERLHRDFGSAVVTRRGFRYYTTKQALERATARATREAGAPETGAMISKLRLEVGELHAFKGDTIEAIADLEVRIRNLESLFSGQDRTGPATKNT